MRILELAKRNFKELLRDRISMAFLIGMPVVFMLIFGFAFRGMGSEPLSIGVVDQDQDQTGISQQFVGILGQISALTVFPYSDQSDARGALRLGDLDGVLIIPNGFSAEVLEARAGQQGADIPLEALYDQSELVLKERLVSIVASAAVVFSGVQIPVSIEATGIQVEDLGYMNILGPGMTAFGLLILIPASAALIATDKETGMMARLLTTPLRPWEFIAGYSLPYIPLLLIQIALYLGIAYALGLKFLGSFVLAYLILFILGLSSLAIGMIIGTFIKHPVQASAAWLVIVPMAMLSGAWFSTEGMNTVMRGIAKAFPPTYAISATQDIVSRGLGFGTVATDFYILLGFALGLLVLGAMLFSRMMAR